MWHTRCLASMEWSVDGVPTTRILSEKLLKTAGRTAPAWHLQSGIAEKWHLWTECPVKSQLTAVNASDARSWFRNRYWCRVNSLVPAPLVFTTNLYFGWILELLDKVTGSHFVVLASCRSVVWLPDPEPCQGHGPAIHWNCYYFYKRLEYQNETGERKIHWWIVSKRWERKKDILTPMFVFAVNSKNICLHNLCALMNLLTHEFFHEKGTPFPYCQDWAFAGKNIQVFAMAASKKWQKWLPGRF